MARKVRTHRKDPADREAFKARAGKKHRWTLEERCVINYVFNPDWLNRTADELAQVFNNIFPKSQQEDNDYTAYELRDDYNNRDKPKRTTMYRERIMKNKGHFTAEEIAAHQWAAQAIQDASARLGLNWPPVNLDLGIPTTASAAAKKQQRRATQASKKVASKKTTKRKAPTPTSDDDEDEPELNDSSSSNGDSSFQGLPDNASEINAENSSQDAEANDSSIPQDDDGIQVATTTARQSSTKRKSTRVKKPESYFDEKGVKIRGWRLLGNDEAHPAEQEAERDAALQEEINKASHIHTRRSLKMAPRVEPQARVQSNEVSDDQDSEGENNAGDASDGDDSFVGRHADEEQDEDEGDAESESDQQQQQDLPEDEEGNNSDASGEDDSEYERQQQFRPETGREDYRSDVQEAPDAPGDASEDLAGAPAMEQRHEDGQEMNQAYQNDQQVLPAPPRVTNGPIAPQQQPITQIPGGPQNAATASRLQEVRAAVVRMSHENRIGLLHAAFPNTTQTQIDLLLVQVNGDFQRVWAHLELSSQPTFAVEDSLISPRSPLFVDHRPPMFHAQHLRPTANGYFLIPGAQLIAKDSELYSRGGLLLRSWYAAGGASVEFTVCNPRFCRLCSRQFPDPEYDLEGKLFVHSIALDWLRETRANGEITIPHLGVANVRLDYLVPKSACIQYNVRMLDDHDEPAWVCGPACMLCFPPPVVQPPVVQQSTV